MGSTFYVDNTSQVIIQGPAYFGGSLEFCPSPPASSSNPFKVDYIAGCAPGGAVTVVNSLYVSGSIVGSGNVFGSHAGFCTGSSDLLVNTIASCSPGTPITVTNTLNMTQNAIVGGAITVLGSLTAAGGATVTGGLTTDSASVSGTTTTCGLNVTCGGSNAHVSGGLTVDGAATIGSITTGSISNTILQIGGLTKSFGALPTITPVNGNVTVIGNQQAFQVIFTPNLPFGTGLLFSADFGHLGVGVLIMCPVTLGSLSSSYLNLVTDSQVQTLGPTGTTWNLSTATSPNPGMNYYFNVGPCALY
jgi:hypothetical protein